MKKITNIVVSVDSSNIEKIAYNPFTRALAVRFVNGTDYGYADVSQGEFLALILSDSIGVAFNQTIKNTKDYRKLS